jgi:hypothetical protein
MLGYVLQAETPATNALLAHVAQHLTARGVMLAGALTVQGTDADHMVLRLLPGDTTLRISENRGALALGCRLDSGALAQAAHQVETRLARGGVDLLILNKFGKTEAEGGGFRAVMGAALIAGVPVLTSVPPAQHAIFAQFVGDMGTPLPGDAGAVLDWCLSRLA